MRNVHVRHFAATPGQIRRHLDAVWTGTEADVFPRDVLRSWRKNPAGVDPLASVPGQTRVGHGIFAFALTQWDGARWRVSISSKSISGWHGFDLEGSGEGSLLVHTVEAQLRGSGRLFWPLVIEPMHDFVVEALFDRLEEALRTGAVPTRTTRVMPWRVKLLFRMMRLGLRGRGRTVGTPPAGHAEIA